MPARAIGVEAVADGALLAFRGLSGRDAFGTTSGRILLNDRSLPAPGKRSANGTCELFPSGASFSALNLTRDDDIALIPALLEGDPATLRGRLAADDGELVARARLMGLPAARLAETPTPDFPWSVSGAHGAAGRELEGALVVDLSSLWAGPLASSLLVEAGARVIKLESSARPDASREATPAFFDLMNAGKESVVLDFANPDGRRTLGRLLRMADVVIEASRPRALRQYGLDPESFRQPHQTWISITGYGRSDPAQNWVAFGDDAAVAGGLVDRSSGRPNFLGDAIADPLTGLHAACAAVTTHRRGGGLVDVALAKVAAFVRRFHDELSGPIERLPGRTALRSAAAFASHTDDLLAEVRGVSTCN